MPTAETYTADNYSVQSSVLYSHRQLVPIMPVATKTRFRTKETFQQTLVSSMATQ